MFSTPAERREDNYSVDIGLTRDEKLPLKAKINGQLLNTFENFTIRWMKLLTFRTEAELVHVKFMYVELNSKFSSEILVNTTTCNYLLR